jgi:hypothetical protein
MEQRPKPSPKASPGPLKRELDGIFNAWADGILWSLFYDRQLEILQEFPELFESIAGLS